MTSAFPDPTDDELAALIGRSMRLLPDEVPPWATQRALNVWRVPEPASPGLLATLTAVLRFDSWQGQPGLALRSRGAASRQLLFAVGPHDFDLRVQAHPGEPARFEITGQVLGPATRGSVVWQPEADVADGMKTLVDDLGEFVLVQLPAGKGRIRFDLDGQAIDLPTIELGPPASPG